jgi:hypothetical protein
MDMQGQFHRQLGREPQGSKFPLHQEHAAALDLLVDVYFTRSSRQSGREVSTEQTSAQGALMGIQGCSVQRRRGAQDFEKHEMTNVKVCLMPG